MTPIGSSSSFEARYLNDTFIQFMITSLTLVFPRYGLGLDIDHLKFSVSRSTHRVKIKDRDPFLKSVRLIVVLPNKYVALYDLSGTFSFYCFTAVVDFKVDFRGGGVAEEKIQQGHLALVVGPPYVFSVMHGGPSVVSTGTVTTYSYATSRSSVIGGRLHRHREDGLSNAALYRMTRVHAVSARTQRSRVVSPPRTTLLTPIRDTVLRNLLQGHLRTSRRHGAVTSGPIDLASGASLSLPQRAQGENTTTINHI
nr:hypothetical protein HmN_000915900 [Hymenolepis microstoma]